MTQDKETIEKQKLSGDNKIQGLQSDKIDLEAQVMNLRDKVAEMERMRRELGEIKETRRALEENERDLLSNLEAIETTKNALELDLGTTKEIVKSQNQQLEEFRERLFEAHAQIDELSARLDEQIAENKRLLDQNRSLDRDLKVMNARCETQQKELDANKRALDDVRDVALRTTGRVRQRYYKTLEGESPKRIEG
ncbi:MAG: hypothetical protein HQL31_01815 [Planctomycetes bacterium]|nr:hypothetical protein [Planctomycetota bacterium]